MNNKKLEKLLSGTLEDWMILASLLLNSSDKEVHSFMKYIDPEARYRFHRHCFVANFEPSKDYGYFFNTDNKMIWIGIDQIQYLDNGEQHKYFSIDHSIQL